MTKIERWRVVPETDGKFLVSTYGRVYSLKSDSFISGYLHKSRAGVYRRVNLGSKKFMVHRLVAEAFLLKPCQSFNHVDHWDGNTLNNNIYNLEWVSQSENIKRCYERKAKPEGIIK